jgi:hypothetical protein
MNRSDEDTVVKGVRMKSLQQVGTGTRQARRMLAVLTLAAGVVAGSAVFQAQQLDICGCSGAQSLGAFSTLDSSTWPPGTQLTAGGFAALRIPLPADGVMVFDSMLIQTRPGELTMSVQFIPNARNTPVTLLVKGDVTINNTTGYCCTNISVGGTAGTNGNAGDSGKGGLGGPGGFRGGDGAYQLVNLAAFGGAGLGPGGGEPGTPSPLANGANGTFVANRELLPLIGGSGGGGGPSATTGSSCSGGGGGGGGGAIAIIANGTIRINNSGLTGIYADGASGGNPANNTCSRSGGSGSGGAIRLVAANIAGSGYLNARPSGRIRMEAIANTFPGNNSDPIALRSSVPGPPAPVILPTVAITSVGGIVAPAIPAGGAGGVDITLPTPGTVTIDLQTGAVPSGTIVDVFIRPRIGGGTTTIPVTLSACGGDGVCNANVSATLAAGSYTVEARATFQTP